MEGNRDRVLHPLIPSSPQPPIPLRMDEITLSTVGSSPRKTGNKVLLAAVLGSSGEPHPSLCASQALGSARI